MDIVIYFIIFAFLIMFFAYQSAVYKKRKAAEIKQMIMEGFGNLPKREYKGVEFPKIKKYFQEIELKSYIDDITWNDMGMDNVFKSMNHTWSAIGEDCLYARLRKTDYTDEELQTFDGIVSFFEQNPQIAMELEAEFVKLGRTKTICIYKIIRQLSMVSPRKNVGHIIRACLLAAAIVTIFFEPLAGVLATIIMTVANVIKYYSVKREIDSHIICFSYVLKMVEGAKNIGSIKEDGLQPYIDEIKDIYSKLKGMTKGVFLIAGNNMSGSLVEILMEYIRMLFHVDLMKFNSMLKDFRVYTNEINRLYELFGLLESAYAVASYRTYLKNNYGAYCKPDFAVKETGVGTRIHGDELYHPLISNPVSNSITETKSVLLTGSNASGKSTFLKTVGINAVLSQTIYTCTGQAFSMKRCKIYSSMSLKDDLENNDSYYMVEIKALKRIMDAAEKGENIICFVDEVLRGTNTVERVSASTEILKYFAERYGESVLCFAATHDIELTELLKNWYANYHFQEEVIDDDVLFNYKLNEGRAVSRNAIQLLKVMGYDEDIIMSAKSRADKFMKTGQY